MKQGKDPKETEATTEEAKKLLEQLKLKLKNLADEYKILRDQLLFQLGGIEKLKGYIAQFKKHIEPNFNKNKPLNYKEQDFIDHFLRPLLDRFLTEYSSFAPDMKKSSQELYTTAQSVSSILNKKSPKILAPSETPEIIAEAEKQAAIQKERFESAKEMVEETIESHKQAVFAYRAAKKIYQKELADYKLKCEANPTLNLTEPIEPIDPDKTLLDGVTMQTILMELGSAFKVEQAVYKEGIDSSKTNKMGYYCGPSATTNLVMNYNPEGYVKAVIELATVGETQFFPETPVIKLPEHLKNGSATDIIIFKDQALAIDLVFGGSLRATNNTKLTNSLNKHALKAKFDENGNPMLDKDGNIDRKVGIMRKFFEGTLPMEIEDMLLDCGIELDEKSYHKGQSNKDIDKIEKAVAEGKMPILFENHILTNENEDGHLPKDKEGKDKHIWGALGIHFITRHEFSIQGDEVEFTYWEYGAKKKHPLMSRKRFLKGLKGYWIPEAPSEVKSKIEQKTDKIF